MIGRTLTAALADLAIEFPEVPDLDASFDRLGLPPVRRPSLRRVVAGVIVAAFALITLIAPVREAVADWLGISVIRIVEVDEIVEGLEDAIGDLGDPIGVGDAGSWPSVLGPPGQAYAQSNPDTVSLVWAPRTGLPAVGPTGVGALLTRFEGTLDEPIIEKTAGPGTDVMLVTVGGSPGYWLGGAVHAVGYLDPEREIVVERLRLAGNTLIWESAGLAYRLESGLDLEAAIVVAESLGN